MHDPGGAAVTPPPRRAHSVQQPHVDKGMHVAGFLRRSSARLGALGAGLVLIPSLLLVSGATPPDAATAATPDTASTAATTAALAAKVRCPKPHIAWSKAGGETSQFGWLLEPGMRTGQQRSWLQYTVTGGKVICDSVTLNNPSRHAITVRLYGADAYNTNSGGFAFTAFKQKPTGVGTWVKLPFKRVTVPAGKAADIPIKVRVPTNVSPGDATGGVVAQDTKVRQGQSVAGGASVGVRAGVGVRIYATVAGLRQPKLSLTKLKLHLEGGLKSRLFGSPSATVSYQVGNAGNVILTPQSTGTLKTRTRTYGLKTHRFGQMLPGGKPAVVTEKVKPLGWRALLGRVTVRVTASAPGARPVTKEVTAYRTPWLTLAGAGGVVAAMAGAAWIGMRRRNATGLEDALEERDTVGV
jgi:hypothetical protein